MNRVLACLALLSVLANAVAGDSPLAWPRPVPCRIGDGANPDLFVMTLGDVVTPMADGRFDPARDEVTLSNGTVRSNYFRDTLGVRFYQPMDKSRFPLPPSGWCTWYYYYNRINEAEVRRNTDWIAEHLKDFGAQVVQIDDGWQGAGGRDGGRDWTSVNPQRFPGGMARLAGYIKSRGLTPGLWLAPHGQSNPAVVTNTPGVFLLKPDATSASDTWEGRFLVDPSAPESQKYLTDLFTRLRDWGFDYFKIDGQPIVVDEYESKRQFMRHPIEDASTAYRRTLEAVRAAIGPDRYLLGCWGTPLQGAGVLNGSRTGGDVVLGWGGFLVALRPTMEYYYLHNIVWYSDPDVILVRPPLTLDQARAWTTLAGLTGQALLSSDRLTDLSDDRVELLRRIYPAADIRPLDLFPSTRNKRIWDLKVNHLGRNYDVVGVFNFRADQSESTLLRWAELGIPTNRPVHVFDFWSREYLGAWSAGMAVDVSPSSCRVLTLLPDSGKIALISTSRHITQGWIDLSALKPNAAGDSYSGTSRVVKDDPYELRFVFPRGTNCVVKHASARAGRHDLPLKISNHQGWATLGFTSPATRDVTWEVEFAPAETYHFPASEPSGLWLERVGLDGANLHWREQYYLNDGYQVYLDGQLLGRTANSSFPIRGLDPRSSHTIEIRTVAEDGRESPRGARAKIEITRLLPSELALTELEPARFNGRWRGFEADEMTLGGPLKLGERQDEKGLAGFGDSDIEFDVKGLYGKFTARVGLDAEASEEATADFAVLGDGNELWTSGPMKKSDPPKDVECAIVGVDRLTLRSTTHGGRRLRAQADWVQPALSVPSF